MQVISRLGAGFAIPGLDYHYLRSESAQASGIPLLYSVKSSFVTPVSFSSTVETGHGKVGRRAG